MLPGESLWIKLLDVEGAGWGREVGKVTVFTSGAPPIANKLAEYP